VSELEIAMLVLGAGCLLAALSWRVVRRRRARRLLHDALFSADPAVRLSALAVLDGSGLTHWAGLLVEVAALEPDPHVRFELARLVGRHKWEPLDTPELAQLHLWARRELQHPPRDAQPPRAPAFRPTSPGEQLRSQLEELLGEPVEWARLEHRGGAIVQVGRPVARSSDAGEPWA
jgi:hypothetical protein